MTDADDLGGADAGEDPDEPSAISGVRAASGLETPGPERLPVAPAAVRRAPSAAESGTVPAAWTFPVRPVALMTVYSLVFYFSLAFSNGPNPYGPLGMLCVALVALAGPLCLPGRWEPSALYRLALPLMTCGLMLLGFVEGGRTAATLLTNSANVAFTLFMLVTLCETCARYGIDPAWAFGLVCAFSRGAATVGMPLGEAFVSVFPVDGEGARLAMCLVVTGVVVLSTVFFDDAVVARSFGMAPVAGPAGVQAAMSYSERVVWQCTQVGRRLGLTQREQEVLELMVQGLPAADIAERAGVSYGTVKTHVAHIYRKLDVHSRDEAVALVRAQGR